MDTGGSVHERTTVPPAVAVAAVLVGLLAMLFVMGATLQAGLRPALAAAQMALVAPALLALLAFRVPREAVAGARLDRRGAALAAGAGGSLWLASLGLLELQYAVWAPSPDYIEGFRRLHDALRPDGLLDGIASVAAIALMPAVCEELLMRGVVLPSLLRTMRPAAAIAVSAGFFAAIHLDLYRTLFTLVLGLALGLLRVRTGSLLACMLAHGVLNAMTFAVAPFADDPAAGMPDPRPLVGLGMLLVGSALTAVVVRFLPSLTHPAVVPRLER